MNSIKLSDKFSYGRLIKFTLPSILSMIFTSLYSVCDGWFVSNFAGKTPFAAVTLVFPVLMILASVGLMLGTGGSAIVSKTYGEGDVKKANAYFSLFVYAGIAIGLILTVAGLILVRPLCAALGASGELLNNCAAYGAIILIALPFNILQMMFSSFFAAAEKPQLSFAITVGAGLTNIILDALLVILLPQPYKLAGAAIATAAGEVLGGVLSLLYFNRENKSYLRLQKTRFDGRVMLKACVNGSSEFVNMIAMSLVSLLYNFQLMRYAGENGVAAYGVIEYVTMIFNAIFVGYSIGAAPLFSFNHGAKNHTELKGLLKKSIILTASAGIFMTVTAELCALPLASCFVGYDAALLKMTVTGLRIFSVSFMLMGFGIFTSGFFTAMNDGVTSAIVSFARTLVFEAASVMILPAIWGVDGIWFSIIVAESISTLLCVVFMVKKRRRFNY